ncbi:MAG: hypothetical protein KJ579_06880, partial [Verrucomicrobia bacterium]|nr:hypothetical protein [Verrucomicrobiota bacterium]
MLERTLFLSILPVLLLLCPQVGVGMEDEAFRIGNLDVAWKQPIPPGAWSVIPEIPLTRRTEGKGSVPVDFGAVFFVAWHTQGMIVRVLANDGDFRPPASDPKLGLDKPGSYDSVEFRF